MDDKLTIVGPEPAGGSMAVPVSVNIEALLLMAKYDAQFRSLLLTDRIRALAESGIGLTETERRLLLIVPAAKLESGIEEFSMRGITRESLPSWKEAAAVILLIMTVLMGNSCESIRGSARGKGADGCIEMSNEDIAAFQDGWCDNNTLRVSATGVPPKNEKDTAKRREGAYRGAVIMAKYRITGKLSGDRIGAGGIIDDREYHAEEKRFKAFLNKVLDEGKVVGSIWDDEDNCQVIYQIRKTHLKKLVMMSH
jgi:hypothetical protein